MQTRKLAYTKASNIRMFSNTYSNANFMLCPSPTSIDMIHNHASYVKRGDTVELKHRRTQLRFS